MRQWLPHRRLDDQVGGVAERTVGLDRLSIRVCVADLNDRAYGKKCTAKKAEHYPQ
jgi:hypothetical protein